MCGRFNLSTDPADVARHFELDATPNLFARYNIAPTQPVAVIRRQEAARPRTCEAVMWGLIPFWAKDPSIASRLINARSETAAEKPAYRAAMKYRRCIVPATGFYEWQKTGREKQPYFIHLKESAVMAMAGLWEMWQSPDGSEIETCTILTTDANELLRSIHQRMPVLLQPDDYEAWLDPDQRDPREVAHLMRPAESDAMDMFAVSRHVNSPKNEDASCMEPAQLF
jgi:putative SOS response-associated peptidase YedK